MDDSIVDMIEELRASYIIHLRDYMTDLELLEGAIKQQKLTKQQEEKLLMIGHKLSGSGATYGYHDVTKRGHALEEYMIENGCSSRSDLVVYVKLLIAACKKALL